MIGIFDSVSSSFCGLVFGEDRAESLRIDEPVCIDIENLNEVQAIVEMVDELRPDTRPGPMFVNLIYRHGLLGVVPRMKIVDTHCLVDEVIVGISFPTSIFASVLFEHIICGFERTSILLSVEKVLRKLVHRVASNIVHCKPGASGTS